MPTNEAFRHSEVAGPALIFLSSVSEKHFMQILALKWKKSLFCPLKSFAPLMGPIKLAVAGLEFKIFYGNTIVLKKGHL
jgi:hypothetical protein